MNWKRSLIVTAAVGVPLIALLAYGMTTDPRDVPSTMPGRAAPVFAREVFAPGSDSILRMNVGDTVRLGDLRGHIVLVNFWASWCLACRDEHRDLSAVAEMYAPKGVKFFGLLYNDKSENGVQWISEMGGQSYPGLLDPGARVAIDYGLYGVPESFVVDQHGKVARKFTGAVNPRSLVTLLDSLLAANGSSGGASTPADSGMLRDTPRGVPALPGDRK